MSWSFRSSRVPLTALGICVRILWVAPEAHAEAIDLRSDGTWGVYDADPASGPASFLGLAEPVCLNGSYPSRCPAGAVFYGWPYSGWAADLSSIPDAYWIWGPGVTGTTRPSNLVGYFFSTTVSLTGIPLSGSMAIAVDDFAALYVNGVLAGAEGSTTDFGLAAGAQSVLHAIDMTSLLVLGSNTITIFAQNGSSSVSGCTEPCSYADDPAGVVFGGTIEQAQAPVPEPTTLALLATGCGGLIWRRRRISKLRLSSR